MLKWAKGCQSNRGETDVVFSSITALEHDALSSAMCCSHNTDQNELCDYCERPGGGG